MGTSLAMQNKRISKMPLVTQTKPTRRMGHTITFLRHRLGFRQGRALTRCSQPRTWSNKLHQEAISGLPRPQVCMAAMVIEASLTECCVPCCTVNLLYRQRLVASRCDRAKRGCHPSARSDCHSCPGACDSTHRPACSRGCHHFVCGVA